MNVLVVDVGGSLVKMMATGITEARSFESGKDLTAEACVRQVLIEVKDWDFDVVSLGYPGKVNEDGPTTEPGNLAAGWVGFAYEEAFGRPVRIVNDAVMQALGVTRADACCFSVWARASDRP